MAEEAPNETSNNDESNEKKNEETDNMTEKENEKEKEKVNENSSDSNDNNDMNDNKEENETNENASKKDDEAQADGNDETGNEEDNDKEKEKGDESEKEKEKEKETGKEQDKENDKLSATLVESSKSSYIKGVTSPSDGARPRSETRPKRSNTIGDEIDQEQHTAQAAPLLQPESPKKKEKDNAEMTPDLSKYEQNSTVIRLATNNWDQQLTTYLTKKYGLDDVTCMEVVTALIAKHNQGNGVSQDTFELIDQSGGANELMKQLSLAIERAMTKGSNKICFVMYVAASVSKEQIRQALLNVQFQGGGQVRKVLRKSVTDDLEDESEAQENAPDCVNEIIVECESRIKQVIRNMFEARRWKILGGHDSQYLGLYSGVVVPMTAENLLDHQRESDLGDEHWERQKKKQGDEYVKNIVDMAIIGSRSSQQSVFSKQLKLRDEHCRVHGEACPSTCKLSAGHLFDQNDALYKPPAMKKNKSHVHSVTNGYRWCREFEDEWGKRSVCIDPNDGYLSFTRDFNYEAASIIPGTRIALAKFGQDEKDDIYEINDDLKNEPTQKMITAYHNEIFLPKREEIVKKAWLCPGCKSRFGEEKDVKQHMNNKECIGEAIKDTTTCACGYCDDTRTFLQLWPNEKPPVLPNQRRQQLEAALAKDLNMDEALPSAVSTGASNNLNQNDDDTSDVD